MSVLFSHFSRQNSVTNLAVIPENSYHTISCSQDESVHAIAIDSTRLKRFGRGEWHQENMNYRIRQAGGSNREGYRPFNG